MRAITIIIVGLLVIIAAMSCAGGGASSAPARSGSYTEPQSTSGYGDPPSTSKYTQTWAKQYADTTCDDWLQEMTGAQRFAGAADMLTGARNKGDGGTGLPPDSLIVRFGGDVSDACSAEVKGLKVAEVAATIYLIDRDRYAP